MPSATNIGMLDCTPSRTTTKIGDESALDTIRREVIFEADDVVRKR